MHNTDSVRTWDTFSRNFRGATFLLVWTDELLVYDLDRGDRQEAVLTLHTLVLLRTVTGQPTLFQLKQRSIRFND